MVLYIQKISHMHQGKESGGDVKKVMYGKQ